MSKPLSCCLPGKLIHCLWPFFLALLLLGCEQHPAAEPRETVIRLDKLAPLPAYKAAAPGEVLRVAVAAILSPQGTAASYQPLFDELAQKLGQPVQMVQRRTYSEINDLIAKDAIDLAFVCTGAYQAGSAFMSALVVPRVNGKITYRAVIIARKDAGLRSFAELRGKVFAFSDPMSNTGFSYPHTLLDAMHEDPETFFSRTIFTYSHEHSIGAVVHGMATAASVDELVYLHALKRDAVLAKQVTPLQYSRDFPMPPVVAPRQKDEAFIMRLRQFFLQLHQDESGRKILESLDIERFVLPGKEYYE